LFADRANHINGIENFWNQAKRHMRKFNGVPKEHFRLFLEECEWRFNTSKLQAQLKPIKQWGNLQIIIFYKIKYYDLAQQIFYAYLIYEVDAY